MSTEQTPEQTPEQPLCEQPLCEPPTEFIVDDAELLSILAPNNDNHASLESDPLDLEHDVPDFINECINKKRKRQTTPTDSEDDNDEDFNFLDQFEFVDVSFDDEPDTKKSKTFDEWTLPNDDYPFVFDISS